MSLIDQALELESQLLAVRRQIAQGPCMEYGHDWKHIGGMNAGCDDSCGCSIPVFVCTKCNDCDYGENPEAHQTIVDCKNEY